MIVLTTTIIVLAIAFLIDGIIQARRIKALERDQVTFAKALLALNTRLNMHRLMFDLHSEPDPEPTAGDHNQEEHHG